MRVVVFGAARLQMRMRTLSRRPRPQPPDSKNNRRRYHGNIYYQFNFTLRRTSLKLLVTRVLFDIPNILCYNY